MTSVIVTAPIKSASSPLANVKTAVSVPFSGVRITGCRTKSVSPIKSAAVAARPASDRVKGDSMSASRTRQSPVVVRTGSGVSRSPEPK